MSVAADQLNGTERPGLEGRWWRFWVTLADGGWLGIAVVCVMVAVILGGTLVWYVKKRRSQSKNALQTAES